jgi:hypothetical protein
VGNYKDSHEHEYLKKELKAIYKDVMTLTNLQGNARLYLQEDKGVTIEGIEAISKYSMGILTHLFNFNQINLNIDEQENEEIALDIALDINYKITLNNKTINILKKKLIALSGLCGENKKKEIEADINLFEKEKVLKIKTTKEGIVYLNNSPVSNMSKKLIMNIFNSIDNQEKSLSFMEESKTG